MAFTNELITHNYPGAKKTNRFRNDYVNQAVTKYKQRYLKQHNLETETETDSISFIQSKKQIIENAGNSAIAIVAMIGIIGLCCLIFIDALDKTIYPGCKVLYQIDDILIIELDEKLFDGSGYGSLQAAILIKRICMDGYKVLVWDRIIDLEEAILLVEYGGGPVPLDYHESLFEEFIQYKETK